MDDSGKFSRGRKGVVPPALAYPAGQSPHDLDRERAVLNGILLAPDVLPEVLDLIRSDDFYHTAHQEIFKAMLKLMENRTPIDVISLAGQLKDNALLDGIGVRRLANMPKNMRFDSKNYLFAGKF
jgi:replicative DNA helicase